MAVQALGYAGFGSAALDDWRQFGTGLVGLQAVERSPSLLAFRMDDRKQRIVRLPMRRRWKRSRPGSRRPRSMLRPSRKRWQTPGAFVR